MPFHNFSQKLSHNFYTDMLIFISLKGGMKIMKKFLLALSAISLVIIFSSVSFAYTEDDARDALIVYSGTDAFMYLSSEERSACMAWVADGGYMNELCRNAITKLISEAPDAVSSEHRQALLAAASGRLESSSEPLPEPSRARTRTPSQYTPSEYTPSQARTPAPAPAPQPSSGGTVIKEKDNTGAIIAAGVVGVIAGMVIHNNLPRDKGNDTVYYPVPERRPPHHEPTHHRPAPPRRH